jgi:hypothetical protein
VAAKGLEKGENPHVVKTLLKDKIFSKNKLGETMKKFLGNVSLFHSDTKLHQLRTKRTTYVMLCQKLKCYRIKKRI